MYKMNSVKILSIVFVFCCLVGGLKGCTTPSGGVGKCQSLYDCQPLLELVNKPNRTPQELDLLRRSSCGFTGNIPNVCCPSVNERTPNEECYTPEGKPGQCIGLYSCPGLSNLLKPPVPTDKLQFVQASKCNGTEQYSVCCGPVPNFEKVEIGNCKSRVTAFPPDPRTECCGIDSSAGNKIVGGEATGIDEYPWLALIEYVDDAGTIKTLCGGGLISGKYVITAGHCVVGKVLNLGRPKSVRLGEYDSTHEGPDCVPVKPSGQDCTKGAIRIAIERTIPHPEYDPAGALRRNDIALLRLAEMAPFTDFIRPICLPTIDRTQGTDPFNATVAGWGAVSTKQSSSSIKLYVTVPFVPRSVCQPIFAVPGRNIPFWNGQFCAGGQKGKDSCKGDSGGPLMYENGRTYEAIGVVSFGVLPCGVENIPGVYTNVYEYNTWIRSNIVP